MSSNIRRTSRKAHIPTTQEDTQPNELLTRRINGPPTIRTTRPLPRRTNFIPRKYAGTPNAAARFAKPSANSLPRFKGNSLPSQPGLQCPPSIGTSYGLSTSQPFPSVSQSTTSNVFIPPAESSRMASTSPRKPTAVLGAPNLADMIMATATSNHRRTPPNSSPSKRRKVSVEATSSISNASPRSPSANPLYQTPPTSRESSSVQPSNAGLSPLSSVACGMRDKGLDIPQTQIKQERETSPIPIERPKLATEGSMRFAPLPPNCQPSHKRYQVNRRSWQARNCASIKTKGIEIVRVLIRKSKVPVMSDTLLPPPPSDDSTTAIVLDLMAVDEVPSSVTKSSTECKIEPESPSRTFAAVQGAVRPPHSLPLPRRSLPRSQPLPSLSSPPRPQNLPPFSQKPQSQVLPEVPSHPSINSPPPPLKTEKEISPDPSETLPSPSPPEPSVEIHEVAQLEVPPLEVNLARSEPQVEVTQPQPDRANETPKPEVLSSPRKRKLHEAQQALEERAVEFLRLWFARFDTDRSELASAYAENATFSISNFVNGLDPSESPPPWSSTAQGLKQGCLEILETLLSLPEDLKFCPSGTRKFAFDVAVYEIQGIGLEAMLVCYPDSGSTDTSSKGKQRRTLADEWCCDQRFILRPRQSEDTRWPLIAVSHQMTFRRSSV